MTIPRPPKYSPSKTFKDITASPEGSVNGRFHALGFKKKYIGNAHVFYSDSVCFSFAGCGYDDAAFTLNELEAN